LFYGIKEFKEISKMEERRRSPRIQEDSEVIITVGEKSDKYQKENVMNNHGMDISTSGIRISTNIFLPMDTLLMMDIKLKYLQQKIRALGKVKWIKVIIEDESYEAGVQFVSSTREATHKLADYISWKLNTKDHDTD
jgi:hypothetical protein